MAKIPEKKHGSHELNELRARNAFAVRPPVQQLKNQALHPFFLGLGYALCAAGGGLAYAGICIPGLGCAGGALLLALFIFLKKPRSRHHAAMMTIISLLVLVFGSIYYQAQTKQPSHDPQGPIRY